ncbi:metal ABC transporter ATP-binding protein [Cryptosporangium arvum]|uniref:ATPase component of Mn/Zn ABC-type transporter n=1 Tax=Cryptosporangium arvum DSM 44712 TaxID=927661 RepID=A0A010ZP92_9ACTN|nr:ABC transporter ATP-binding protein [Cryptosporangium arvum]EXG80504.1 ATPase component of Mn/Zn ABC-type transporter [Cryptosporangium arvum DSM 44712]
MAAPRNDLLEVRRATLAYGSRVIWQELDLAVRRGEFLAVLGANGSGKTSLLRVVLGLQPLSSGTVLVDGARPRRGSNAVGYVAQQRASDSPMPQRAKDLVGQGLDGHRWGIGLPGRDRERRIRAALDEVGALSYADWPIGALSGGEQQRVRIAQALVADPRLLLCDEPLSWLDVTSQQTISSLVDRWRREHDSAVLFVTHDINPVLPYVDRVLYMAGDGQHRLGTVDEVLTGDTLSALHGAPVDVVRLRDRIVIVGLPEAAHPHGAHPDPAHPDPAHPEPARPEKVHSA